MSALGQKQILIAYLLDVRFPPESGHFVSPIEMPVYHWKLAGAATMRICTKIE
jgi:hypothetical protein